MDWRLPLGLLLGVGLGVAATLLVSEGPRPPPIEEPAGPRAADRPRSPGESPPTLEGDRDGYRARMEASLHARDTQIARLEEALEKTRGALAAKVVSTADAASPAARISELSREQAGRLGVSPPALEAAWNAREGCYQASEEVREALIAPLRAYGEEGLNAILALMLGRKGHIVLPGIIGELRLAGGDEILIRAMEARSPGEGLGGLLVAMGQYDTPRSRQYLVDRIAREEDAGNYWNAAQALAQLKESRGAQVMRVEHLSRPGWDGVRGHILYSIGQMGGDGAVAFLDEYLRQPHADHVGAALNALHGLDEARASEVARALKSSDRYGFLPWYDRRPIDSFAEDGN